MKKSSKEPYVLTFFILLSTFLFSILGAYWNTNYYHNAASLSPESLPLASAMLGLHDGLYAAMPVCEMSGTLSPSHAISTTIAFASDAVEAPVALKATAVEAEQEKTYSFTTATDDYFHDACFIGDSRTVGISEYAGIEGATFLCKSSLSIYDYDKPKITYENTKTSVKDVLSREKFAKIYLMVGINECGTGTPESFFEYYRSVVEDIRKMQPDALIFIQGNLLVTDEKSKADTSITNDNISARNQLISTLSNQRDIFYIDINESTFCENNALIPAYTWDQVHIKAQYYADWKTFLLEHAIIPE